MHIRLTSGFMHDDHDDDNGDYFEQMADGENEAILVEDPTAR